MQLDISSYNLKNYELSTSKKRITLRGCIFEYYHVKEKEDGTILLEPRELREPFRISENTLHMMDTAVENIKAGITSDEIDLSEF